MTDETTQALLPCPFCEETFSPWSNVVLVRERSEAVQCPHCGARGPVSKVGEGTAEWNTRLAHSLPSQASDAGEEMLREVLVDHFPTGLRGSYERTAGGIVVDTGMKTDCHCGWSAQASDEHEVRDLWARHVAATLTAPPTSGEEMRLREALGDFGDDYMTSEQHHPGYVLIPSEQFERIRAALTKGAE